MPTVPTVTRPATESVMDKSYPASDRQQNSGGGGGNQQRGPQGQRQSRSSSRDAAARAGGQERSHERAAASSAPVPNRFSASFPNDALRRWSAQFWAFMSAVYVTVMPYLQKAYRVVTLDGRLWGILAGALAAVREFLYTNRAAIGKIGSAAKTVLVTGIGLAIMGARFLIRMLGRGYQSVRILPWIRNTAFVRAGDWFVPYIAKLDPEPPHYDAAAAVRAPPMEQPQRRAHVAAH